MSYPPVDHGECGAITTHAPLKEPERTGLVSPLAHSVVQCNMSLAAKCCFFGRFLPKLGGHFGGRLFYRQHPPLMITNQAREGSATSHSAPPHPG